MSATDSDLRHLHNLVSVTHTPLSKYVLLWAVRDAGGGTAGGGGLACRVSACGEEDVWYEREFARPELLAIIRETDASVDTKAFVDRIVNAVQTGELHLDEDRLPSELSLVIHLGHSKTAVFDSLRKTTVQVKNQRTREILFELALDCGKRGCRIGGTLREPGDSGTANEVQRLKLELQSCKEELARIRATNTLPTQSIAPSYTGTQPLRQSRQRLAGTKRKPASIANPRTRIIEPREIEFEDA